MIVATPESVKGERARDSHGGSGGFFVRTLFESPEESPFRYLRDLVLDEGASIGDHPHDGDDEIYFVISGTGTMHVDGDDCPVGPGSAVLTQSGSRHGLVNTGDTLLRICVVCASADVPEQRSIGVE